MCVCWPLTGTRDQIADIHWNIKKSKRVPEKQLLLLYWLCQSLCLDHNKLWKILQEVGISEHLICLLRNLYAGQEATVRTGHAATDWFQIGKGVRQGCILSPFLTYMQCTLCEMLGWKKHKLESRLLGEISITSDMQMKPPYDRKWRSKEPLDESERGEWKRWLKTQHSETKIIASGPITSWQIDGETVETVSDFIFWDSKITADGDCSHEIKRCLLLGRKAMTNLDSVLKSRRNITLPTNVHLVKAVVFPVVMYGCESWTIKNAESQKINAFVLWFWRRLENPLDCKEIQWVNPKGNQSCIFIGRTDDKAEALMLWPPDVKSQLFWKDPDGGKNWRQEEKGPTEDEMVGWHHQRDGHEFE